MEAALAPYPAMTTTDSSGFAASARAEATMAAWVNLLGLLVIVGYLIVAVVNSLVVATNVRRREIALLRLVGMTRAQVLRAMRWEALMTVVCAVLLGTVVGGLPLVVQAFGFLGSFVPCFLTLSLQPRIHPIWVGPWLYFSQLTPTPCCHASPRKRITPHERDAGIFATLVFFI